MILTGEHLSTRSNKTCPSATFSTTNITWTDLGSSQGLRGNRSATNRLSHGTKYYYDTARSAKNAPRRQRKQPTQCHCAKCNKIMTGL
jgi:hypothetical protein